MDLSNRQFDPLIVEAFLASEDAFERLAAKLGDPLDVDGNAAARLEDASQTGFASVDAEPAAIAGNPNLEAAQKQRDASRFDVSAAKASRSPQVSIGVGSSYYNYLDSLTPQARSVMGRNPDGISTTLGA
ncbi:MAG: TolC family protein, partial [Acidobacteria bacterium]|nr:TolC family protein [Acidobacteriota bacterium]